MMMDDFRQPSPWLVRVKHVTRGSAPPGDLQHVAWADMRIAPDATRIGLTSVLDRAELGVLPIAAIAGQIERGAAARTFDMLGVYDLPAFRQAVPFRAEVPVIDVYALAVQLLPGVPADDLPFLAAQRGLAPALADQFGTEPGIDDDPGWQITAIALLIADLAKVHPMTRLVRLSQVTVRPRRLPGAGAGAATWRTMPADTLRWLAAYRDRCAFMAIEPDPAYPPSLCDHARAECTRRGLPVEAWMR